MILSACEEEKNGKVIYDDSDLTFFSTDSIIPTKITTDFLYGNPLSMDFVMDSLIVFLDKNCGDYSCHIINKEGVLKKSFGMKGKRNIELIHPDCFTVSSDGKFVYVYDFGSRKIVKFDIVKVMSGEKNAAEKIDLGGIIYEHGTNYGLYNVYVLDDNRFIGQGYGKNRFVIINNNHSFNSYTQFPSVDQDIECNQSLWREMTHLCISHDRKKLVVATYIGALFETFDLIDCNIFHKALKAYYPPKYQIVNGTSPKIVATSEETIVGFNSLYAGDDYIYTSVIGPDYRYMNNLLIYDYDGTLRKKIDTGCIITCQVVDENGNAFFFAYNEQKELNLYKCLIDVSTK